MLTLILIASIVTCVLGNSNGKFIGGNETTIEKYPYQAALLFDNYLICGGSIIGPQWILTAAHCISDVPTTRLYVRVGSSEHATNGVVHKVKRTIAHRKFSWVTMDFDYSLVELEKTIEFGSKVQPIDLPEQDESVIARIDAAVTGWGRLSINNLHHDDDPFSSSLTVVQVKTVCQEECNIIVPKLTDRMFCAGIFEPGKSSCGGDSGGPLVSKGKLVGIVSYRVADCATPGIPSIYAQVSKQRNWIKETTGI